MQFTFKYVKMMACPFSLQMILEMFPTKLAHSPLWFTVLLHSEVSLWSVDLSSMDFYSAV